MSNEINQPKGIERRNFLKALSVTGAGSMLLTNNLLAGTESEKAETSRVVIVSSESASDKATKKLNADIVQAMVDDGIKKFTGLESVGDAWKSIFPGITAASVIGLKVNTLFSTSNVGTHPAVTYAVANGLKQISFDGTTFPENNIIIFDFHNNYLSYQGYTLNKTTTGVRCFQTPGYSTEVYTLPDKINQRLSTVITESIDFMVNIAQLKHHFLSGVSLCLKNHYGSINNPEVHSYLHDSSRCGDPYIPAITAFEPIKTKQKFCMIDAIYGLTNGGPMGSINCNPNKIVMGQDVVAVDSVGREMLKNLGLSDYNYKKTTHIDTAATTYNLGTNDLTKIEKIEIAGPVKVSNAQTNKLSNYPNPFTTSTTISFELAKQETVSLNVYEYSGKLVAKLLNKRLESGTHTIIWDGTTVEGNKLKTGVYLAELRSKSMRETLVMQKFE